MRLMLKALAAFAVAAWFMGNGPFAGSLNPHWQAVAADLAAAHPEAKLAQQAEYLFRSGTPHPDHH